MYRPPDVEGLSRFLRRSASSEVSVRVLGRGANVLIRDDGFDGVVVRLDQPGFRSVRWRGSELDVGAGVDLMKLCKRCSRRGIAGLEAFAGIPATVGGAIRMNAGGHADEFGDVVTEVDVVDRNGRRETLKPEQIGFRYRHTDLEGRIVVRARLGLRRDNPETTRRRYEEHFAKKQQTQPIRERSAGCVFKNPPGQSAGMLIDRAGLKGTTSGGARVSERHANFIVADRTATASDVLRLIDVVRDRVAKSFGTELETEVEIW